MYELYITNKNYSSWSLRAWILMRQLDIPFNEHLVPLPTDGSDAAAIFGVISPSARVPSLHDDDTIVWDTIAIAEYLAERHTGVWPTDPRARAWARSAAAEMHAGFMALRTHCSMNCGIRVRLDEVPAALERELARLDALWSDGLSRFGGPFLGGAEFTAVDAFYAPVAFRVQTYHLALGGPSAAYAARLLALPGMRAWYTDALAETWREPAHEAEPKGAWLEDLRA